MIKAIENSCMAQESKQNPLLTRKETANILQISLPTLHSYTKQGILKSYVLGNIIRYKYDEVLSSFQLLRGGQSA